MISDGHPSLIHNNDGNGGMCDWFASIIEAPFFTSEPSLLIEENMAECDLVASINKEWESLLAKRKFMKPQSIVWNHFTKIKNPNDGSETLFKIVWMDKVQLLAKYIMML